MKNFVLYLPCTRDEFIAGKTFEIDGDNLKFNDNAILIYKYRHWVRVAKVDKTINYIYAYVLGPIKIKIKLEFKSNPK